MHYRFFFLLLFFSASCNSKDELLVDLSSGILYDSCSSVSHYCIIIEIENTTDVKYYTTVPDLYVVGTTKSLSGFQKFTSDTGIEYRYSLQARNLSGNNKLIKEYLQCNQSDHVLNEMEYLNEDSVLDSFVYFKLRENALNLSDSSLYYKVKAQWVFLYPFQKKKFIYLMDLTSLSEVDQKIKSIKCVTRNAFSKKLKSVPNKFLIPETFAGFTFFNGKMNNDSIILPVIY